MRTRGNPYLRSLVAIAPLVILGGILTGVMLNGAVAPWQAAALVAVGTALILIVVRAVSR